MLVVVVVALLRFSLTFCVLVVLLLFRARGRMQRFVERLRELGARIHERNKSRPIPLTLLLPENLECSVAV